MIKRGERKGQFYLVTSFIIISVLIGFIAVTNYSKKKTNTRIYELSEEYETEAEKVFDYAILNNFGTSELIRNFTKSFAVYSGENIEIYTIYGIRNNLISYKYINNTEEPMILNSNSQDAWINVNQQDYKFTIQEGENFYYVIRQNIDGENYVVTN